MSDSIPSYLKPIDAVLGGGSSTPTTGLTLQQTGFGSLFTAPPSADGVRFLFASTHIHQATGYSKVSQGILKQLAALPWLQVTHFGFQKNAQAPPTRNYPSNVEAIDAAAMEKPMQQGFGWSQFPEVIRRKKPHVVMIQNDLAVVARFCEEIRKSGIPRTFQLWIYCDQVQNTQLQGYLDILNRDADRIFAFTAGWKKCLKDQGITRPIDVLHHGFDSDLFYPIPRELARSTLKLPKELFLFLNLNRNQPRKRQDLMLMAFVELIVKYPTKPLYLLCVCDKGEKGGWWLFEIFQRELKLRGVAIEAFSDRLILTSQDMNFRDEDINMFYNAADVGISTADGEGWGLCQFEHMGVGVPQVVPAVGGYTEQCRADNSQLVTPKFRFYLPTVFCPVGGEAHAVDPHDVCLAMEEQVLNSEKRAAHGEAARKAVQGYTWAAAVETLVKRLQNVKEDLSE